MLHVQHSSYWPWLGQVEKLRMNDSCQWHQTEVPLRQATRGQTLNGCGHNECSGEALVCLYDFRDWVCLCKCLYSLLNCVYLSECLCGFLNWVCLCECLYGFLNWVCLCECLYNDHPATVLDCCVYMPTMGSLLYVSLSNPCPHKLYIFTKHIFNQHHFSVCTLFSNSLHFLVASESYLL